MIHDAFLTGLHSEDVCARASCEDRCGKSSTDDDKLCSCDHRCQTLGDCCVDFSTVCSELAKLFPGKEYKIGRGNRVVIKNSNASAPESERHLLIGFRQIDHCPQTSTSLLQDKCRDAHNKDDIGRRIPVCHSGKQVVFQNQYCAYCNGYSMNELVPFELHVDISSDCKGPDIHGSGSNIPRMSLKQMVEECTTQNSLFVPEPCFAAVYRNKMYVRRDQSKCKSHLNTVISTISREVYQNEHCLPRDITDIECFNGEWPSPVPTNVPSEVNDVISLDSSGVPFLLNQLTSPSKTPIRCVSIELLLAIITRVFLWCYCTFCDSSIFFKAMIFIMS